jgi:hypothetical protein
MLYLPSDYGPIDRSLIPIRQDLRDDMRKPGRILIDVPGLSVDWTLHPDRRDVRRWRAVGLDGKVQAHAAWPTILRQLAAGQPQALGRRHWGG